MGALTVAVRKVDRRRNEAHARRTLSARIATDVRMPVSCLGTSLQRSVCGSALVALVQRVDPARPHAGGAQERRHGLKPDVEQIGRFDVGPFSAGPTWLN